MGVYNQIMMVCLEVCLVLVVMTAVQGCAKDKVAAWTGWGYYSDCSATCGGYCTRTRRCDNPDNNGDCKGDSTENTPCWSPHHTDRWACPVDGGWGTWGSYDACSTTCGVGTQTRHRACDTPSRAHNGKACFGTSIPDWIRFRLQFAIQTCRTSYCPVDGGWGTWGSYGTCSKTCGGGTQGRQRACDKPAPEHGGKACVGDTAYLQTCQSGSCPVTVDADVSTWGVWGACSTTCGGGSMSRSRSCVPPRNGGRKCPTELTFISQCNTNQCPVHGNWGRWHQITTCAGPCGGGTLQRIRSCDKPSPMFGGDECRGERAETRACKRRGCPGAG